MAIDDEPLALRQVAAYIAKTPFLTLAAACQSALEAAEYLKEDAVDVIFCDINMPDLNGMDFVRSLAAPPLVVFTTAYSEYAVEGYKVDAVDYLLKPFGLDDFTRAARKVRDRLDMMHRATTADSQPTPSADNQAATQTGTASETPVTAADDSLFVKTDYRILRLRLADISYIEGMSEYLKIHMADGSRPVITLLSMKRMEDYLPQDRFMRIHRSYIINLDHISELNKSRITLTCGDALPIGDNYREAFQHYLGTRFLGK